MKKSDVIVKSIAILDDDTEMADLMRVLLAKDGRNISLFSTAGKFLDFINQEIPDFLVLDMNLPGINGRDLLRVLRGNPKTAKMLILAVSGAMKETSDIISSLDLGADDYLTKPFDNTAFQVRVDSLLLRNAPKNEENIAVIGEITVGPLIIDVDNRTIILDGREVVPSPLEFDLLIYFIRQRNRVVSRGTLLQAVWKGDPVVNVRAVDKRVEILRGKLGKFGNHIETVFGIGYMFRY